VAEVPVGDGVVLGAVVLGAVVAGACEWLTFDFELPPPHAARASEHRSTGEVLARSRITAATICQVRESGRLRPTCGPLTKRK
jgi:hypothetical protein